MPRAPRKTKAATTAAAATAAPPTCGIGLGWLTGGCLAIQVVNVGLAVAELCILVHTLGVLAAILEQIAQ